MWTGTRSGRLKILGSILLLVGALPLLPTMSIANVPASSGREWISRDLATRLMAVLTNHGAAPQNEFRARSIAFAAFLGDRLAELNADPVATVESAITDPTVAGNNEVVIAAASGGGGQPFCNFLFTGSLTACRDSMNPSSVSLCINAALSEFFGCHGGSCGLIFTDQDLCPSRTPSPNPRENCGGGQFRRGLSIPVDVVGGVRAARFTMTISQNLAGSGQASATLEPLNPSDSPLCGTPPCTTNCTTGPGTSGTPVVIVDPALPNELTKHYFLLVDLRCGNTLNASGVVVRVLCP